VVEVVVANLMFEVPAVELSETVRWGAGAALGEIVATLGLVMLIFVLVRRSWIKAIPASVGSFIAGAYFFTSSTAFANPAVTVARTLTDSAAGIAPGSVPGFVLMQAIGALLATTLVGAVSADRVGVDPGTR
jgi:uncharacterized BrkB/YihY/UPF0761 family membrane protein